MIIFKCFTLFLEDIFLEKPRGTQTDLSPSLFKVKTTKYSPENTCAGLSIQQTCNFIKKRVQHRCFPVNIAKFLKTPILRNVCERLRLTHLPGS